MRGCAADTTLAITALLARPGRAAGGAAGPYSPVAPWCRVTLGLWCSRQRPGARVAYPAPVRRASTRRRPTVRSGALAPLRAGGAVADLDPAAAGVRRCDTGVPAALGLWCSRQRPAARVAYPTPVRQASTRRRSTVLSCTQAPGRAGGLSRTSTPAAASVRRVARGRSGRTGVVVLAPASWRPCGLHNARAAGVHAARSTVRVNGQVVVPAGGQLKVPTPRVDQRRFVAVAPFVRASRMR